MRAVIPARRTVSHETPTRSAITTRGATAPAEVSNASSTRARLIIDALRTPVVVTRSKARRSSAHNATGYFFCEDTAPLPGRTEATSDARSANSTNQEDT
ncbi:hypothetical protein OG985_47600 [Streptomyces sp. NBC_00289]|uniref:hypothetical protein n=1 Tax=Streptomyces sp. NBC_00289 TaxID=2975703 RepID=UPI0032473114